MFLIARYLDKRFVLYYGSEELFIPMSVAFSCSISIEGPNLIRRHLTRPDPSQYIDFLKEISVSPAVTATRCLVRELKPVHCAASVDKWFEGQTNLKVVPWSFSSPEFTPITEFLTELASFIFYLLLFFILISCIIFYGYLILTYLRRWNV